MGQPVCVGKPVCNSTQVGGTSALSPAARCDRAIDPHRVPLACQTILMFGISLFVAALDLACQRVRYISGDAFVVGSSDGAYNHCLAGSSLLKLSIEVGRETCTSALRTGRA